MPAPAADEEPSDQLPLRTAAERALRRAEECLQDREPLVLAAAVLALFLDVRRQALLNPAPATQTDEREHGGEHE